MSKRKDRKRVAALYESVVRIGAPSASASQRLGAVPASGTRLFEAPAGAGLPKMKKFRFQLLHQWLIANVAPCRVADIGGGKGLLAYLLQQSGWHAMVIDPHPQPLPEKYRDLEADRQLRIAETERVRRVDRAFEPRMAADFDLLVAMHAHGCSIQIIDAAAARARQAIILPCCIIDEPLVPPPGVHWLQCLADYAVRRGLRVEPFRLNFKGQNIGLRLIPPVDSPRCE
jgi:hypothetical protein